MNHNEWLNEAKLLSNRLVSRAALEASYSGGPLHGKYRGERQAAQGILERHLAAHPSAAPQGAQPAEPVAPQARMLTDDETAPILDEIIGNYPSDLAERIVRKAFEVNAGLTIPAKEPTK